MRRARAAKPKVPQERIHLSDHFTFGKLIKFVAPSIIMMVFVSIYSIVDGIFVANYADNLAFAALNLIFPFIMLLGAVGFMLGAGGNAVVSKALGEGDSERANRIFSMLVYATAILGVVLGVTGILVARPVAELFAQTEKDLSAAERTQLIDYCVLYARIILAVLPAFMLQNAFQGFFVTAEKGNMGLLVTIGAGLGNILLDVLFVGVFKWGLVGAALATAINQLLGGVIPLIYFFGKNDSLLQLGKTKFDIKIFGQVCFNGSSELMTNVALSVVTILYNAQLMRYVGIDGVSAYGVMNYIGFIFISVFLGYSVGSTPIVGFHYGANNKDELKNVFHKSLTLVLIAGGVMLVLAELLATPLSAVFVGNNAELLALTTRGLRIFAFHFMLAGLNIFASSFFTALSNGALSLLISFSRTFVCQVAAVFILPLIWQVDGIWAASIAAELISLILSATLLLCNRKRYGYA